MQSLTFIVFIVSEKITTLKFLPHTDTGRASLTLIITIDSHFSCKSKIRTARYTVKPGEQNILLNDNRTSSEMMTG